MSIPCSIQNGSTDSQSETIDPRYVECTAWRNSKDFEGHLRWTWRYIPSFCHMFNGFLQCLFNHPMCTGNKLTSNWNGALEFLNLEMLNSGSLAESHYHCSLSTLVTFRNAASGQPGKKPSPCNLTLINSASANSKCCGNNSQRSWGTCSF